MCSSQSPRLLSAARSNHICTGEGLLLTALMNSSLSMGMNHVARLSPKVNTCCPITCWPVVWSKWLDTPGIFLPYRVLVESSSTKALADRSSRISRSARNATSRCKRRQSQSSRFNARYWASFSAVQKVYNDSRANRPMESTFSPTHSSRQYTNSCAGVPERLVNPTLLISTFIPAASTDRQIDCRPG